MTVTAVLQDSTATMTLNSAPLSSAIASSPITLAAPRAIATPNVIVLRVTAQDGSTQRTYTITLTASAIPTVVANTPCATVTSPTVPALLRGRVRSLFITVPTGQNYEFLHVSALSNDSSVPISLFLRYTSQPTFPL